MTNIATPKKGDPDYDAARRPASPLSKLQAQRLTDRIAKGVEHVWSLIQEARDKKAWAALGYASWDQYVRTEFGMSRGQGYRLLDQARVIGQVEAAADLPRGTLGSEVSARAAADLKPRLEEVTAEVREAVATEVDPAKRAAKAREVVQEARSRPASPPIPAPAVPVVPQEPPRPTAVRTRPHPGLGALEAAVVALVEFPPVAARDLSAEEWRKLGGWLRQAQVLRDQATDRHERKEACRHPIGRRLGDRCGVCGEAVKGR